MEQENTPEHYLALISNAQSYQELVFLRNRVFEVMEHNLSAADVEAVKRAWTERAKDKTLPVVPSGQKKVAAT